MAANAYEAYRERLRYGEVVYYLDCMNPIGRNRSPLRTFKATISSLNARDGTNRAKPFVNVWLDVDREPDTRSFERAKHPVELFTMPEVSRVVARHEFPQRQLLGLSPDELLKDEYGQVEMTVALGAAMLIRYSRFEQEELEETIRRLTQ
jgi:hypothetical protein